MFAYINETDCHGTLIELGMAVARHKQVVVAFGPNLSDAQIKDLWMCRMCADTIDGFYTGTPKAVWAAFLKNEEWRS